MSSFLKELSPKEMEESAKKYEALKRHFSKKYFEALAKVSKKYCVHGITTKTEAEYYEKGFNEALDLLRLQLENDLR